MQIPSKWRTSIPSLLQILARGMQLVWQAKEKTRTERLHGLANDEQTSRRATYPLLHLKQLWLLGWRAAREYPTYYNYHHHVLSPMTILQLKKSSLSLLSS